jgi:DNA processing protein
MAIPGSPMDPRAGGCNALIRDGATLVRDAADIAEVIGIRAPTRDAPALPPAPQAMPGTPDGRLLDLIGPVPVAEDILIRELGQPAASVSASLLDLELAGLVQRHPGGMVSRMPA